MKRLKKTVLALFVFVCPFAQAQNFAWKSNLDTVLQTGFYSIRPSPQWRAVLKADLSDVRILDEKRRAVPFLIKQTRSDSVSLFVNFPILKNVTDSVFNTLELEVLNGSTIDRLDLVLGNTAVERKASLSGSNDRKRWFIIDENLFLKNKTGYGKERFMQSLAIPLVRYRYLKLQIRNRGTDPLRVEDAGVYVGTMAKETAVHFEKPALFQQRDSSDGYTYIRVKQKADYPVEKIRLVLSGPKFFARQMTVFRGETATGTETIVAGTLYSGADGLREIGLRKMKSFLMTIENGENPPLQVDSVAIQFTEQALVAYLEKEKRYSLVGGDSSLAAPAYDLALFRDSIPAKLPSLNHGPLLPFAQNETTVAKGNNRWLWPSIIGAVLLLGFLTAQLLREVKRKEN